MLLVCVVVVFFISKSLFFFCVGFKASVPSIGEHISVIAWYFGVCYFRIDAIVMLQCHSLMKSDLAAGHSHPLLDVSDAFSLLVYVSLHLFDCLFVHLFWTHPHP